MIVDQRRKRGGCLIVGGMRFIHQTGFTLDARRQIAGSGGFVVDDFVMIELDSGLHHQRRHPRPGCIEAAVEK